MRQVSQALVDAYLARRVLDHLLGMELSQLLWRKLPGATSAGARPWLRSCCWLGRMSGFKKGFKWYCMG